MINFIDFSILIDANLVPRAFFAFSIFGWREK